jgi:nucleotide-binding universal stress UspA family protein
MTTIVVGYDLSLEADRAVEVVAATGWPPDTVVHVVTSLRGLGGGLSSFAGSHETQRHAHDLSAAVASAHERVAARLAEADVAVETSVVAGAPARAVIDAARAIDADLIVVGAGHRSSIVATLAGSVSGRIVEEAHCPVLVVRVESLERVVLATDGSPAAEAALDLVESSPLFAGSEVRVVGVVLPPSRYTESVLSGEEVVDTYAEDLDAHHMQVRVTVDRAVDRLVAAGRRADAYIRVGAAADEIARAVNEWPGDVIVLGSRGASLVRRVLLGTVTRSIAEKVASSVVVVRPRIDDGDRPGN